MRSFVKAALIAATVLGGYSVLSSQVSERSYPQIISPTVLRAPDRHGTPVGLVYSPEVLAFLLNRSATESADATMHSIVRQAIALKYSVVVMWRIPDLAHPEVDPVSADVVFDQQYLMQVEYGDEGDRAIRPIWISPNPSLLKELDPERNWDDVGAVAAFPKHALRPDSRIVIYLNGATALGQAVQKRRVGGL